MVHADPDSKFPLSFSMDQTFTFTTEELYQLGIFFGVIFLAVWVSSYVVGAGPKLRREIRRCGLDEQEVNRDFMRGTVFRTRLFGIINIGYTYTIYASRGECFVLPNGSIHSVQRISKNAATRVKGIVKVNGSEYGIAIHALSDTKLIWIGSDEVGRELMVEEFKKRRGV